MTLSRLYKTQYITLNTKCVKYLQKIENRGDQPLKRGNITHISLRVCSFLAMPTTQYEQKRPVCLEYGLPTSSRVVALQKQY